MLDPRSDGAPDLSNFTPEQKEAGRELAVAFKVLASLILAAPDSKETLTNLTDVIRTNYSTPEEFAQFTIMAVLATHNMVADRATSLVAGMFGLSNKH